MFVEERGFRGREVLFFSPWQSHFVPKTPEISWNVSALYKTVIPTELSRLMSHKLLFWVSMAVQVGCQGWRDVSKISHCAAKADHVQGYGCFRSETLLFIHLAPSWTCAHTTLSQMLARSGPRGIRVPQTLLFSSGCIRQNKWGR